MAAARCPSDPLRSLDAQVVDRVDAQAMASAKARMRARCSTWPGQQHGCGCVLEVLDDGERLREDLAISLQGPHQALRIERARMSRPRSAARRP